MNAEKRRQDSFNLGRIFTNSIYGIKLLFQEKPLYGICTMIEATQKSLITFLGQTLCMLLVLESIIEHKEFFTALVYILVFVVLDFASTAYTNYYQHHIKVRYFPEIQKSLKLKFYRKAREIDLACYDDPKFYKDNILIVSQTDLIIEQSEQLMVLSLKGIVLTLCYTIFFLIVDSTSVVFVIASLGLRIVMKNVLNRYNKRMSKKEEYLKKKQGCIQRFFYNEKYAKQLRLNSQVSETMHEEFKSVNEEICKQNEKIGSRRFYMDFITNYLLSDFMLLIVYAIYLAIQAGTYHMFSVAVVVVLYNSVRVCHRELYAVAKFAPVTVEISMYIQRVKNFLNYQNKLVNHKFANVPKSPGVLEFRHVTFGYEENNPILINVNLKILPEERIAFVGDNKEGKSTLMKLLLRFYDPIDGGIFLDGVNIKDFDINEYRNYIGAVFADFQLFAGTLGENVVMDTTKEFMRHDIEMALHQSGFIEQYHFMKDGYETTITTELDDSGVKLQSDDAQQVALARCFYKQAGVIMLDESEVPTDPLVEYMHNNSINASVKDKTIIYFSQRFSPIRDVDHIYLLKDGYVVEQGSHKELLSKKGLYSKMWEKEISRYLEEKKDY